ncbi:MAG: DinB family protein [Acidithiobacillales bacterium]
MAAGKPAPLIPKKYATALAGDDPLDVMAASPDRLRRLLRGLTEKQLSKKPAPGKWSIKEIVAHLADGEVILGSRYRLIGAHDRPAIASYDQDAFVAKLGAARATSADLADDFAMARAVNLGLLDRLPDAAWDRVGLHAERGEESIRQLVHMYAGHDRHHLQQIETIRTGLFPKAGKRATRKTRRSP